MEFCALNCTFLWIGREEVWCAKPKFGCALRSFFLTLTCRDAKETPQDPRAGKLWIDLGEDGKLNFNYLENRATFPTMV